MLKRYRYRAYPTGGQMKAAVRLFGCCRVVWNDALARREQARRDNTPTPSHGELSADLTHSKRTPERAWLADVSAVPLQQSLADLDHAWRNFFGSLTGKRKGRRTGPPRFKKRTNRQAARFTRNANFHVTQTTHGVGFVSLPKIGHIRYNASRPLPSDPSSVTLILEPDGHWHVSFVVDVPPTPLPPVDRSSGIDVGLIDLATVVSSDGTREKIPNPHWARTRQRALARAQRALSRKQRGSRNRAKAARKVATEHRNTRDTRLDFLHKLALRLVRENQTVAVEGLSVTGLARTRMAKSVHDAGWGILLRLLQEKALASGREIVVIERWAPTTQVCSICGTPGGRKPLGVRAWTCNTCGTVLDRDYNAAVNIMVAAGLAETENACGGSVRLRLAGADPVKQEPTEQTRAHPQAA